MNRRPTVPGGAVEGSVKRRSDSLNRRLLGGMLPLLMSVVFACTEPDVVMVQVNGAAAALTITVDYMDTGQRAGPADQLALQVGDSVSLSATALNAVGLTLGGVPATWSSSAPAVAEITAAGLLRAMTAGTAEITATLDGVSASVLTVVSDTGGSPT